MPIRTHVFYQGPMTNDCPDLVLGTGTATSDQSQVTCPFCRADLDAGGTRRETREIISEIRGVFADLSPENLYRDGERSADEARRVRAKLSARLSELFTELGGPIDEWKATNYVLATDPAEPTCEHYVFDIGTGERLVIDANEDGASLKSGVDRDDVTNPLYGAAVDGAETLLLSLATEGVDLNAPAIAAAVQTVFGVIGEQYGDGYEDAVYPAPDAKIVTLLDSGHLELAEGDAVQAILDSAAGRLDDAEAHDITGAVLFQASDGKYYVGTVEFSLGDADSDYVLEALRSAEQNECTCGSTAEHGDTCSAVRYADEIARLVRDGRAKAGSASPSLMILEGATEYGEITKAELDLLVAAKVAYLCPEAKLDCAFEPTDSTDSSVCNFVHLTAEFAQDEHNDDPNKIAAALSKIIGRDIDADSLPVL